MKLFFLFFFTISFISSEVSQAVAQLPSPFNIIPHPQKIELFEGEGIYFGQLKKLTIEGVAERPVMGSILSVLTESEIEGGTLTLKLVENSSVPESPEGYILSIHKGNATILSKGAEGLFYGCQTLEQMLEDARDYHVPIPSCKITDYPSLTFRSVQIDVKHHLDQMRVYYEMVDKLAKYKINAIIFEFEDKLRYKRQPLVGAPHAISIDEMAALTRYAKKRNIEINPLVQGLGHATFILKHDYYAHLRELSYNRWAFCPLDEGTYEVLFDLYLDAIEATPGSRYLHVGGDEIGNIGLCSRCKPTADKDGLMSLNLYWLKRVCEFAEKNGRIPIFWDDMLLSEAGVHATTGIRSNHTPEEVSKIWESGELKLEEAISGFFKNSVFMRWNYSMARQQGNIRALDWYSRQGLNVMIATAAQCGPAALFPFDTRNEGMNAHGVAAIQSFLQLGAEKNITGMLCTAWDDRSPHFETYWRGYIASAEYSWNPDERDLNEYDLAWLQREFGVTIPDFFSIYNKLREASVFWEKAFYKNGSRLGVENALFNLPGLAHWLPPKEPQEMKTDFTYLLIDLPNKFNPGEWSEKYHERLMLAEKIVSDYKETSNVLNALYAQSRRNRYHWQVFIALNDFQNTAPKLLLALRSCDSENSQIVKEGKKEVLTALYDFEKAWEKLEFIYSKTRFTTYPKDYIPDRYFHFASQREDLTYLIQSEELLHKMVKEWLNSN